MGIGVRGIRGLGFGIVLAGVVFGAFAGALVSARSAHAQVSQIVVEGNRRVEAETIRSYFKPGPGERLDAAKIDSALKTLYGTGLFQDVHINQTGGRLVVSVVENPVINRIAFEGNKKAKDEQILLELQSKPRGTFSRATVQSDVSRIVEIYQRSGRYDVTVEPKIIELPNNRVDLVFEIKEGPKTGVAKIIFVGNKSYSDWRLKDVIKTGQTNWLSWIKNNDIFDPDRVEVDRDLLRRFYLRHGFADVRIVSALAEYEPSKKGFVITFTIEEGDQYKFGSVDVQSSVRAVPGVSLLDRTRTKPGNVYNADLIEKSVEDLSIEVSKRGYPFAVVRPRGDRDPAAKRINVVYTLEEGPHVYIERINIRGNTRTRDYVIRREFDITEGDAYNRALVERAERRIKNLNYFKSVKFTNEPGSAPDRIIVNVDVEEQSTGEFSVAGGYSTSDGFIGEVSVGERNLLGTGLIGRASVTYGGRSRGFNLSLVEPYLLGNRMALGIDIFGKEITESDYTSYTSKTYGANLRLGIPITDNIGFSARYSGYRQEIELPDAYKNCNNINPDNTNTFPTTNPFNGTTYSQNCYYDGEASLPVKMELAQGPVFVSLVGYGLTYNTLDNNKSPTSGLMIDFKQDLAGVGGDVNFLKSTVDARYYQEILPDVVGMLRGQAGHATGWGGKDLRMLDHFHGGPNLVRGFQTAGFGPRDLTSGTTQDSLGGTMYWAASAEVTTPLFFAPKDFGMKLAAFVDAGSVWDYTGPTSWAQTGETLDLGGSGDFSVRASAGLGLIWESPFGPLRFDVAYPIAKESWDKTQVFRFGGGTKF
jgi:outer membrane protein insertion porin family